MFPKMVALLSFRQFIAAFIGLLAACIALPAHAQTNYADVGITFLNKVNTSYIKALANSHGSAVPLYASAINPNNGNAKNDEIAEMFSEKI